MRNDEVETTVFGHRSRLAQPNCSGGTTGICSETSFTVDNADLLRHLLDLAFAELSDVSAALLDASEEDEPEA